MSPNDLNVFSTRYKTSQKAARSESTKYNIFFKLMVVSTQSIFWSNVDRSISSIGASLCNVGGGSNKMMMGVQPRPFEYNDTV